MEEQLLAKRCGSSVLEWRTPHLHVLLNTLLCDHPMLLPALDPGLAKLQREY